MNLGSSPRGTVVWMAVAAALLLTGLAIDVGFTRPRAEAMRSLLARREALSVEIASAAAQESAARRIQARLGEGSSAEAVSGSGGSDLAWLAGEIDAAGLRRQEIVSREVEAPGRLRSARYSLRAMGRYSEVLELVRRLESSRRLVIVESLQLRPADARGSLEAGLDIVLASPGSAEGDARP